MVAMWCLQLSLLALAVGLGASLMGRREAKKPELQDTKVGKLTLDLDCDPASALKALDQVKASAAELERTFGRIELRQERVLGAVREAKRGTSKLPPEPLRGSPRARASASKKR